MPSSLPPERRHKRCLIAADGAGGPWLAVLELAADATIGAALEQARLAAPEAVRQQIDWDGAAVGLWGVRCDRASVPAEGDRIELYRPLAADPRQRRRQNAGAARRRRA